MNRLLTTAALLAALALPAAAGPFGADDLPEARGSGASTGKLSAGKSALKCKFVNGQLVCTF